ncbi:glutathione S-transferase [Alteromonadaceae bacterium 2753L.S.0a.02]|nr:glutathione S-transferase [Alteromonadaceae bacterium 2753L.S.0a.02]
MRLIGMLDSPYVRRVAISLEFLGLGFTHEAKSVFTTFEEFKGINPVVKAPTLICDDNEILMDSSLILQFVEASLTNNVTLWPDDPKSLPGAFRAVCLSLAACDKGVQLIYERNLRPETAQFEPWIERVSGQIQAALEGLEIEIKNRPALFSEAGHASIASAIAWQFISSQLSGEAILGDYPNLVAHSEKMEMLDQFKKYPPVGPGVKQQA